MSVLKESLNNLQVKLDGIEDDMVKQLQDLDQRGSKWFSFDEKKERLLRDDGNHMCTLNVGGKIFKVSLLTILNHPDCLFFNLIMTDQWNHQEELFFDRSYKYFHLILTFLRNHEVNLNGFSEEEIVDILKEAKFYYLMGMIEYVEKFEKYGREITVVGFEFSGEYRSGNNLAGTNDFNDLNNFEDVSCMKGICTAYTGWIILELSREVEFDHIEISGYKGNTNIYASSNGSGANISTSTDKTNWTIVGTISSEYANTIYKQEVNSSTARYVKLHHNSYLGIGYFRVHAAK